MEVRDKQKELMEKMLDMADLAAVVQDLETAAAQQVAAVIQVEAHQVRK